MTPGGRFGLRALLLFGLAACGNGDAAKRAEVKSVSMAIDRVRDAANPEKASKLTELLRVPCSIADVCQLRDRCAGAYALQVEALGQIAGFKDRPPDGEKLASTQQKLEAARQLAHECLEAELTVGRKFGTQI